MCALPQQLSDVSTTALVNEAATAADVGQQHEEPVSSVLYDLLRQDTEQPHHAMEEQGDIGLTVNQLHTPGWTTETEGNATPSAVQSAMRTPQEAGWQLSVVGDMTAEDRYGSRDDNGAVDAAQLSPMLSSGLINTSPAALVQTNALLEEVLFDLRYRQLAELYDASTTGLFADPVVEEEEKVEDEELRTMLERTPSRVATVEAFDESDDDETMRQPHRTSAVATPQVVLGSGPLVDSPGQVSAEWALPPQSWSASIQQPARRSASTWSGSSSTIDSDVLARRLVARERSRSISDSSGSDSDAGSGSSDSDSVRSYNIERSADRSGDAEMAFSDDDALFERAHVRQITALIQSQHRVLLRGSSCLRRPSRTDTHSSRSDELSYDSGDGEVQYDTPEAAAARITEVDSDEACQFLTSPATVLADVDQDGDTRDTALSGNRSPMETRPISKGVFASPSQVVAARDGQNDGEDWRDTARVLPRRRPVGRPSSSSTAQWTSSAVRSARRVTTTNTISTQSMPPPLLRGLRQSACSTFWSPSVRLSVATATVPRVVIEEQQPIKQDEGVLPTPPHSANPLKEALPPTATMAPTRCYTRPNFRVTIYPRTQDVFQDKSTHERIQSQLIATLTGVDAKHVQTQRTRWFSIQRNPTPQPPPMSAAPTRPLPDVPGSATDGNVTTTKRNSKTYTTATMTATYESGTCSCCCSTSSTDFVLDRRQSSDLHDRPLSIGATATTIKRTSWQRNHSRDSWVSVTESETSYCSWVSYTSRSSISSSSSVPAEWSRRVRARVAAAASPALQQVAPSPLSQNALSPGPPSSCLMPPALLLGSNRSSENVVRVPELPSLSPFSIDVYEYWPVADEVEREPALVKWARHQSMRQSGTAQSRNDVDALASVARHLEDVASLAGSSHSSDTVGGPAEAQWNDKDSSDVDTATCSCDDDSFSTASSDDSARTLTPPRSEFHQLDSPGLRLHQVLSPLDLSSCSSEEADKQQPVPPLMAALNSVVAQSVAPLRINKAQPPIAQRRPAHRRWILVDDQGKRIEGDRKSRSGSRDSSFSDVDSSSCGSSGDDELSKPPSSERRLPDSGSSMTECTLRDSSSTDSGRKSQHRQSFVMSHTESTQPMLLSQSQCRDIVAGASMAGIGFDTCSSSVVNAPAAAARQPAQRTHPRSILKTASGRWSESTGVRSSNSATHSSTLTSRTNSSTMSVRFDEPVAASLAAAQASVTFALPMRSASMSEHSAGSTMTARQSNMSSSETLISSLELDNEARMQAPRPPPAFSNATPQRHDSSSSSGSRRLTSYDLAMRLRREELRRQRNDERLEALDKLEGKSRKSHLLSGLIKSSGAAPSKSARGVGVGLDGMAGGGGAEVERHAQFRAHDRDHDHDAIPTTPLTPTLEELRQWEREWERTHHVNQFSDNRAQRFTNVIGFDIGIVPFTSQQQARKKAAHKRALAQFTSAKANKQQHSLDSRPSSDGTTLDDAVSPLHRRQSHTRARLERELGAGLRKLSVAVEARHAARERYVDQ